MTKPLKTRVFMSGRSQAVRVPAPFRFTADEVYVRRDPQTGDLILSQSPPATWPKSSPRSTRPHSPPNSSLIAGRESPKPASRFSSYPGYFITRL
jgi:antitoxin VapB